MSDAEKAVKMLLRYAVAGIALYWWFLFATGWMFWLWLAATLFFVAHILIPDEWFNRRKAPADPGKSSRAAAPGP